MACGSARQVAVARRTLQNKRRRIALAINQFTPEPCGGSFSSVRQLRGTLRKSYHQARFPFTPSGSWACRSLFPHSHLAELSAVVLGVRPGKQNRVRAGQGRGLWRAGVGKLAPARFW